MRILSYALLLLAAPIAQAQGPAVPNPSTSCNWTLVSEDWDTKTSGPPVGEYFITTTKTSVYVCSFLDCAKVAGTLQACGGRVKITKGTTGFLGKLPYRLDFDWEGPEADQCELCAAFICGETVLIKSTREVWVEAMYWGEPMGVKKLATPRPFKYRRAKPVFPPLGKDGPPPAARFIKQVCDDSPASKAFCCPVPAESSQGTPSPDLPLEWGMFTILPDQYGLGHGMPDPIEVDLLDVALVIEADLRLPEIDAPPEWGPGPHEYMYEAGTAQGISLTERTRIAEMIIADLGLTDPSTPEPTGRILLACMEDGDATRIVDLGTIQEIMAWDTLRLSMPADVNMDWIVNEADVAQVQEAIGQAGTGSPWDLNLDGWVDDLDLAFVLENLSE